MHLFRFFVKTRDLESSLQKEKDVVKILELDLLRAGEKQSETTNLLTESRRREENVCKWITRLYERRVKRVTLDDVNAGNYVCITSSLVMRS